MKFLCDVHISYKLVRHLTSRGYETIHVNDILDKWLTSDKQICEYADQKDFIVISKDSDFRNSFYVKRTPSKLIKINLGNISNSELVQIITDNLPQIQKLNKNSSFIVEINLNSVSFNIQKD
ncbi:Predicted nuclease, contains PIN domain, potential toxin-antitoxin system component [Tangfeifania diversioriginum]|uniref:Predicted nuclease, contains PIN domain, potential toxin-antitoxin system component n=1 Tax=Tangfeifania diversioriginum TaxID=1168035 RepID=A0A1M6J6L7_9BACT|nr:DUF5615 family PIN-like protein [Tangfeifania diversioriginum]SHJ42310.1 Predicted nuclease, contains PIN domain, potential toxin-antitoxin system component [Tangfeifania diversioriginum]